MGSIMDPADCDWMKPRMRRIRATPYLAMLAGMLLCACAALPETSYKLYPGLVRAPTEIAIVRLGDAGVAMFDGRIARRGDWGEVQLLPGEHTIVWQTEFTVSAMVEPSGFAYGGREEKIMLHAGHVYTLKADRTTGRGYRMYFWVRDETTQRVVAGTPKP